MLPGVMLPVIQKLLVAALAASRMERRRWSQRTGPGKRSVLGRYGRINQRAGYTGADLRALRRFRGVGRLPAKVA